MINAIIFMSSPGTEKSSEFEHIRLMSDNSVSHYILYYEGTDNG